MAKLDISKVRFLIAEDNPFMRSILRMPLGAFGVHDLAKAKDGAEAYDKLRATQPDIILMDWEMEPVSGI